MKFALFSALVLALIGGLVLFLTSRPQVQSVALTQTAFQQALDERLATDPTVGFLVAVRLTTVEASFDDMVRLKAVGNWFNGGAGAFVKLDVTVTAEIALDPAVWAVDRGALMTEGLTVNSAIRDAIGTVAETAESEPNRGGWESRLETLVNDLLRQSGPDLSGNDWTVTAVSIVDGALTFELLQD